MSVRHKISRQGLELIKGFEGLRQNAARLPDGRWTIGYGHTLSAREGATVSAQDAEALLLYDLLPVVDVVNAALSVTVNQNQFDALVSFAFNIGTDLFRQSDVLALVNQGRMAEAMTALEGWRTAEFNGQIYVLEPLVRRREAEKALFLTLIPGSEVAQPEVQAAAVEAVPPPVSDPEPAPAQTMDAPEVPLVSEPERVPEAESFSEPEPEAAPQPSVSVDEDKRKADAEAALLRFYSPYGNRAPVSLVPAPAMPTEPQSQPVPVVAETAPVPSEEPRGLQAFPTAVNSQITDQVASQDIQPVVSEPAPAAEPERHWREVLQRPLPARRTFADSLALAPTADAVSEPEIVPERAVETVAETVAAVRSRLVPVPAANEDGDSLFSTLRPTQLAAEPAEPVLDEWITEDRIALTLDEVHEVDESWLSKFLSTLKLIIFSCLGMVCIGGGLAAYLKGRNSEVMRQGFVDDYTKLSGIMAAFGVLLVFVAIWLILRRLAGLKT